MKIFIDAGHNPKGKDTGAEGFGLKEQDVAFHIAKKLSELLAGAGADTKLSRSAITDVISYDLITSLNARAAMANAINAELFLSIHCNSFALKTPSGTECHVYDKLSSVYGLAGEITNSICESLGTKNRGTKISKGLAVLRTPKMPAILIETAFISNPSGAEKLLYPFRIIYSGEARRKMRQVIDRFHPDIIHFNNINFQLTPSVILAGAERNIPMVQTVHDLQMLCPNHMMMEFGTWKLCEECSGKKCKMACVRKKCIHGSRAKSLIGAIEGTIYTSSHVYDRVARYICPSRFIEEKLLTVPRYAGKTTMIHNFLSKTAEIDVPKGDYVLYFGRLSEEKGIARILAACRLLPEIPFVIAGGGPLEELCRTCELPNVRFVGFKTGRELQELADDHPLKQIYEKRLNTINRYVKRGTLDADLAEIMKKLAKDKMLRALSNVAYAKGDYEREMEQASLKKEAKTIKQTYIGGM